MRNFLATLFLLFASVPGSAQDPYWREIATGTTRDLLSISFASPQICYIGGTDSLLLRSEDGGQSWQPASTRGLVFSMATPDVVQVHFLNPAKGYAVVSNRRYPVFKGALYTTDDSGQSWYRMDSLGIPVSRCFFFDAQNGFAIGSMFFAGKTVQRLHSGTWEYPKWFSWGPDEFLYGIDFYDRHTGMIGGAGGEVYRSFDGGSTWDTVGIGTDSMIRDLKFLNAHTVLAATDHEQSALYVSYDTGASWQPVAEAITFAYPKLNGVARSPKDSFIAVGRIGDLGPGGIIYWRGGGQMNVQYTLMPLNSVTMRDDSVAFIVGDGGLLMSNKDALLHTKPEVKTSWTVSPNPATDVCVSRASVAHTLSLIDAQGRVALRCEKAAPEQRLMLSELPRGVYFLRAEMAGGAAYTRRLVLE